MPFIDDFSRAWIAVSLPGVSSSNTLKSTYEAFDLVPPIPVEVDRFDWLLVAEALPGSALARASDDAVADLSLATIRTRVVDDAPVDLIDFQYQS